VDAALKPFEPKVGFSAPPPNPKTTWMIIWIILGFLAFLSLVFFFRWYSKTKAEKLTDENT
jgi:cytoskeletal protein RodZ